MIKKEERLLKYIQNMLVATQDICEYVQNLSFAEFIKNKALRQATQLNLIILGENAAKIITLDENFVMQHPNLFLFQSKGMRNFIAHQYENVDLDFIFSTATQDIPKLKQVLETLEKELKKRSTLS